MVDSAKLLGVTIRSSPSWNAHINEVIKKASKRLYSLVQLKRARVMTWCQAPATTRDTKIWGFTSGGTP